MGEQRLPPVAPLPLRKRRPTPLPVRTRGRTWRTPSISNEHCDLNPYWMGGTDTTRRRHAHVTPVPSLSPPICCDSISYQHTHTNTNPYHTHIMTNQRHQFQFTGDNLTSEQRYKQIIQAATTQVWLHLDQRTDDIPVDCDWDDLTPEQQQAVGDTLSVEREWILDEDDLRECSMFTFDEQDAD